MRVRIAKIVEGTAGPPNPDGAPKGGHGRYSGVNGVGAPVVSPQDSAFVGSDGGWGVLGRGLMCQVVACVVRCG